LEYILSKGKIVPVVTINVYEELEV